MLTKMDDENKDMKGFSPNENFKEIQIQRTCQICSPFALPTLSGQWGMLEKMDVKNKTLQCSLSLSLSTHENSRTQSPRQSRSRRALKVQIERKLSDTLLFEGAISVNLKGEIRGGRRGGSRVQKCEGSLDVDDTTKLQDVDGSNAHETHDSKHAHANDHRLLRKTHLLLVQPAMKNPKPPACHKWSALENSSAAMKDRVSFQVPGMVKSRVIGEFRVSEIHFEKLMGVFPKHPSHRQKSPWICAIT